MASAAYERRNARARALGYQSYYDYRAHDNGKLPPGAPRLAGEELRRARGHTGAADIRKDVRNGQLVIVAPDPTSRRPDGSYGRVIFTLVGQFEGEPDREYMIRGDAASPDNLRRLVADLEAAGAVFSPSPSMDIRSLFPGDDDELEDEEPLSDEELAEMVQASQDYDDIPF